jgi:hypothetical protein
MPDLHGECDMVWTKLVTTLNVCGVLLTVPAGAVGLYTTYRANFSSEVTCRALRSSILSALETDVDAAVKQALVGKDVAEFAHSCAHGDPEDARALVTAISNNDLASRHNTNTESLPVRVLPPPMLFLHQHWLNDRGTARIPSPRHPREPMGT